jgi:hypothetical protein
MLAVPYSERALYEMPEDLLTPEALRAPNKPPANLHFAYNCCCVFAGAGHAGGALL